MTSRCATNLLEARSLRKSFGEHVAVKNVSFALRPGEVLGLLGPNGAGKSTTMMMVAGLLAPTQGKVLLQGDEFHHRNRDQRRLLGVVPQEYAIYQDLSAFDNLQFFGKLYGLHGKSLKSRCDEVLDQIGLVESAYRPAATYSGGMKRRLNFGVALMHRPQILILDEPTVGVDPQSRSHLIDCVRQQANQGVGVIYASHYMEEVQSICQRVAIIDRGEVLVYDSIQKLLSGLAADIYLYVDRIAGIGNQLGDLGRVGVGADGEPAVIISSSISTNDTPNCEPVPRNGCKLPAVNESPLTVNLAWRLQATLCKLSNLSVNVLRVETPQTNLERLFLELTGKRLRD